MEKNQRHGCVTVWLFFVLAANICFATSFLFSIFNEYYEVSSIIATGIIAIGFVLNVLACIMLLRWRRYGFYLFVIVSIVGFIINLGYFRMDISTLLGGIIGIVIWWGILQIKKNNRSAWSLMEDGVDYKHFRHIYQLAGGIIVLVILLICFAIWCKTDRNSTDTDEVVAEDVIEEIQETEETVENNAISYKVFTAEDGSCSVEAPDDFRSNSNEGQVITLLCTDFDPFIVVVKESVSACNASGIYDIEQYAKVLYSIKQKSPDFTHVKKINEYKEKNAYIIEYSLTIEEGSFYYILFCKKSKSYFYQCCVGCLKQYKDNLYDEMLHIGRSFKIIE